MNFYDIYTTLQINPETERQVNSVCKYCGCINELETLKKALWNKPSRIQSPGAFPFDDETGKIYDTLWKAAQTENYGTAERIGRYFMKLICPPVEEEGMGKFYAKYHEASNNANDVKETHKKSESTPLSRKTPELSVEKVDDDWDVEDNATVIKVSQPIDVISRRGSKKND